MKAYLGTLAAGLVLGIALTLHFRPPQKVVEIKEVVKETTKTKTKRIKRPDGTVITETETTKDKTKNKQKLKTEKPKRNYNLSIYAYSKDLQNPEYGIMLQRRILADGFVTFGIQENGQVSVGVAIEF